MKTILVSMLCLISMSLFAADHTHAMLTQSVGPNGEVVSFFFIQDGSVATQWNIVAITNTSTVPADEQVSGTPGSITIHWAAGRTQTDVIASTIVYDTQSSNPDVVNGSLVLTSYLDNGIDGQVMSCDYNSGAVVTEAPTTPPATTTAGTTTGGTTTSGTTSGTTTSAPAIASAKSSSPVGCGLGAAPAVVGLVLALSLLRRRGN